MGHGARDAVFRKRNCMFPLQQRDKSMFSVQCFGDHYSGQWMGGGVLFICLLILIPLMKLLWGQQSCRQSVLRSHWVSLLCGCTENPGQRDAVDSALPRSLWELSAPQRLLPRPCSGGTFPADLLQVCSTTCPLLGFAVKTSRREGAASGSPELDRSHHPASN